MNVPNADKAYIDMRKLVGYALNPEHPKGGDKALVFASALGLTAADAELLQDALLKAVGAEDAIIGEGNEFGKRYRVDFEMIGPNGKAATVRSGWIIRSHEDFPRLATVYVIQE
jgi:hypothetical protein